MGGMIIPAVGTRDELKLETNKYGIHFSDIYKTNMFVSSTLHGSWIIMATHCVAIIATLKMS